MSIQLKSGTSTTNVDVDTASKALRSAIYDQVGNSAIKVQREGLLPTQGGLMIMGKNDEIATHLRTDRKGNQMVGNYIPELIENFEGTIFNVQKWAIGTATFVPGMTTLLGYVFNTTNLTTTGALHIFQSVRNFIKLPRVPLQIKQRVRANIPTNSYIDIGFGIPSNGTLITPNGVVIRCVGGLWSMVMTYNNAEIATININGVDGVTQLNTSATNSEYFVVDLIIDDDNAVATIQNTQTGVMVGKGNLVVPLSAIKMFGATALPYYSRLVNTGTTSTAPNFTITELQILSLDWRLTPDASQLAGSLGLSSGRNPYTGAQLENHTNSTAPVSATLTNTTAGYATLGGKFQFVALAGAITDYALFIFQVPVGSRFICEGITIGTRNTGAIVATTPTTLEWSMGFNSVAASLITANIVRKQVGHQSFAISAPIEAVANTLDVNFLTPEVTESGRFVQIILTLPVGTATAGQIIRGQVMVKGRFI